MTDETTDRDLQLAEAIRLYCRDMDHTLTVTEIAAAGEIDELTVARILDEWRVKGDAVDYAGPGLGGGWVQLPEEPTFGTTEGREVPEESFTTGENGEQEQSPDQ